MRFSDFFALLIAKTCQICTKSDLQIPWIYSRYHRYLSFFKSFDRNPLEKLVHLEGHQNPLSIGIGDHLPTSSPIIGKSSCPALSPSTASTTRWLPAKIAKSVSWNLVLQPICREAADLHTKSLTLNVACEIDHCNWERKRLTNIYTYTYYQYIYSIYTVNL